ncbi:MAG: TIGR04282 family arsenosugar biosynthesis glycosyltransferase [Rhodospirillales bacterium]
MKRHVILFAKAPRMGRVKTRLARDVGPVRAAAFYRLHLAETLRALKGGGRWTLWLAAAPDTAVNSADIRRLAASARARVIPQGGGDLGRRMDRAMRRLPPGPAVIVGADIIGIDAGSVWSAFKALGTHDAVFGPAPDGGYWLAGLRRAPAAPRPFAPVRWSSEHALADTLANFPPNARVARIAAKADVDTGQDLVSWARARQKGRVGGPAGPAA